MSRPDGSSRWEWLIGPMLILIVIAYVCAAPVAIYVTIWALGGPWSL